MLPILACFVGNALVLNPPQAVVHSGKHKVKHHVKVKKTKHHRPYLLNIPGNDPVFPFYVTLAPGDTMTSYGVQVPAAPTYLGNIPFTLGDSVICKGSQGPTMIHTGDGHVFSLLPGTTVTAMQVSTSSPTLGMLSISLPAAGKTSGVLASTGKIAAAGSTVRVIVKTHGATTGVSGSTFVLTSTAGTGSSAGTGFTKIDIYDCNVVEVDSDGGGKLTISHLTPNNNEITTDGGSAAPVATAAPVPATVASYLSLKKPHHRHGSRR